MLICLLRMCAKKRGPDTLNVPHIFMRKGRRYAGGVTKVKEQSELYPCYLRTIHSTQSNIRHLQLKLCECTVKKRKLGCKMNNETLRIISYQVKDHVNERGRNINKTSVGKCEKEFNLDKFGIYSILIWFWLKVFLPHLEYINTVELTTERPHNIVSI